MITLYIWHRNFRKGIKEQWKINEKITEGGETKERERERESGTKIEAMKLLVELKMKVRKRQNDEKKNSSFCDYCFSYANAFVHKCAPLLICISLACTISSWLHYSV